MASSRHAAQMQLVEVEELTPTTVRAGRLTPPDHEPADAVTDAPGPGPGTPDRVEEDAAARSRRRRRSLLGWGAVLGAVVLTVAVLGAVDEARRTNAYERAVAVPGLLTPLDGPVHVAWRAPASSGEGTVVVADGTVVVVQQDATGGRLSGYDAETGERRWTTQVTGPTPAAEDGSLRCPSWRGGRVGDLVLCVTDLALPVYAEAAPDDAAPDARGLRVVALDATTGERVGSWTQEGDVAGYGRLGDDMVVAVIDADGHSLVQRRAGRTGDVVWTYQSGERLSGALAIERATVDLTDRVAVVRGAELAVLRLSDGAALDTAARGQAIALFPFRDGWAAWTPARGGWLYDGEGHEVSALPAVPSVLAIDDESAQDVVVLSTGTAVQGFDPATGDERWSLSTRWSPRAVVGGTLLLGDEGRWAAYDVRTGRTLWSHEVEAPDWPALTDGSLVLTPVGDGGRVTVLARDLRDGAQRWQVDVPAQVRRLTAVGGLLVGRTDEGIVVLRP